MTRDFLARIAISTSLLLPACGNSSDESSSDDAGSNTDSGSDSDSDSDSDTDSDSDDDCVGTAWDGQWTYGEDYAEGPYGFKGSMCWDPETGNVQWSTWGDTIPDICLNDQNDNLVCLKDYLRHLEFELIFVDFSAVWCSLCDYAADGQHSFIEHLADNGWSAKWITILEEDVLTNNTTVETAISWVSDHSLGEDAVVLYDANKDWFDEAMIDQWPHEGPRGWPTVFVVHTSNMLIWNAMSGWADPHDADMWSGLLEFWSNPTDGILEWIAANGEGAIDTDVDTDTDTGTGADTDSGT